jgi:SAM-dependent methyltransferase
VNELYSSPELYHRAFSWDLAIEREFYKEIMARYFPIDSKHLRIVEFGSGTGRILTMLAQLEHDAVGLELSHEMASFANQHTRETSSTIQADMTYCPFRNDTFDAALCTLSTLNYLKNHDSILKHLNSAFASLRRRAIYIVDCMVGPPQHPSEEWDSEVDGETLHVTWKIERISLAEGSMIESIQIRCGNRLLLRSISQMALIDKRWFVNAARQAGFLSPKWFEPFRVDPITYETAGGRVITVLEKS